ncbi:MAG: DUF2336 domain-containing protein [Hyphomonadaceae bacterium]
MDHIEVARPVIERSHALTEKDILDVIEQKSQDHMMAVTKRPDIGENVSSALVAKGEDRVVASLLENRTARMDRRTFEAVADRAQVSPVLRSLRAQPACAARPPEQRLSQGRKRPAPRNHAQIPRRVPR